MRVKLIRMTNERFTCLPVVVPEPGKPSHKSIRTIEILVGLLAFEPALLDLLSPTGQVKFLGHVHIVRTCNSSL